MITMVTGGIKSGKSSWAQQFGETINGSRAFIATAIALDEEMRERIQKHQSERADKWSTWEEARDIVSLMEKLTAQFDVVLLDCLTMWVSNLLTIYNLSAPEIRQHSVELTHCLRRNKKSQLILVTNEVGMGIIPADALSRSYQVLLGTLNSQIAEVADSLYLMVSGIPIKIK